MLRRIWEFFFPLRDSMGEVHPTLSEEMRRAGLTWGLATYEDGSKEWREVCDFCHGNCGQCGITGRVGNIPASMGAIVKNGRWDSGIHAGLPMAQ